MSASQVSNAFDLLGQANTAPLPVHLRGAMEPQFEISWGDFRQSFRSSLAGALTNSAESRRFLSKSFFKDAWIEKRFPRRAVAAAALWHLVFLLMPKPDMSAPKRYSEFDNTILTWSGPIEDLPLLEVRGKKPRPMPRGEPERPAPRAGADAFHPRQRIFTDPIHPTHPRQTLINPQAPPEAPKLLPAMPNIVQLAPAAAPVRPRIEISERILKSLRPRARKAKTIDASAPAPDVLNNEVHPADLSIAASQNMPARPKLEINAGVAPRLAAQERLHRQRLRQHVRQLGGLEDRSPLQRAGRTERAVGGIPGYRRHCRRSSDTGRHEQCAGQPVAGANHLGRKIG
jgi:hypothetical protein